MVGNEEGDGAGAGAGGAFPGDVSLSINTCSGYDDEDDEDDEDDVKIGIVETITSATRGVDGGKDDVDIVMASNDSEMW